ncbi:AAA family ATPase [Pseudofrankia saprophytica]|uniref:AAA family ATPase n=1 Tax=Pseudofrankia saprophytica TaxID=298655 RepID=UPI000234BF43|nr:AAA family ATPase [Pseudofrankia saprophytica]
MPRELAELASYAELNTLVGLDGVKREIRSLLTTMNYFQLATRRGYKVGFEAQHLVFAGPPGTGKTTVARIFARLLAEMGVVQRAVPVEVSSDSLVGEHAGSGTRRLVEAFEKAQGGVLFLDEIQSLAPDPSGHAGFGYEIINALVKLMEDRRRDVLVIVAGYSSDLSKVFAMNPGLSTRFTRTITFPSFRPEELARIVEKLASDAGFVLGPGTADAVRHYFQRGHGRRTPGNGRAARTLLEAMQGRLVGRVMSEVDAGRDVPLNEMRPEDLDVELGRSGLAVGRRAPDEAHFARVSAELTALPGLRPVKEEVARLQARAAFAVRRQANGQSSCMESWHLVFTGASGTGKTMCARLYGELLAALGMLAQGQLVEVTRTDLVGQWVGQTAQRTRDAFERARGGVLFIDQADILAPHQASGSDFGHESVNTIVKLMEDLGDELVVIAAGRPDRMKTFLSNNPALADRFSRTVRFPDYTAEELVAIFQRLAADSQFKIDPAVLTALLARFVLPGVGGRAANARHVQRTLSEMVDSVALRAAADGENVDIGLLTVADLPEEPMVSGLSRPAASAGGTASDEVTTGTGAAKGIPSPARGGSADRSARSDSAAPRDTHPSPAASGPPRAVPDPGPAARPAPGRWDFNGPGGAVPKPW